MAELIVALDVPSPEAVPPVLSKLGETVGWYKIGLELFCAGGPAVVESVAGAGKRIFLDPKLHDIPRTVARAVTAAARLRVELMTLHAAGGRAMIAAAAEAARGCPADQRPKLLAVTMLTSLEQDDLGDLGIGRTMPDQVAALATMALESGADGVVCSPREWGGCARAALRRAARHPRVRPAGTATATRSGGHAGAAVRDGSTHLVSAPILEDPTLPRRPAPSWRDAR